MTEFHRDTSAKHTAVRSMRVRLGWLLVLLALSACSKPKPSPAPAANQPYCEDTEIPLASDAGLPELDPDAFAKQAQISYQRAFVWKKDLRTVHHAAEGKATALELTLKPTGPVRRLRSRPVYPPSEGPSPLIGLLCPDEFLELPVDVHLKTRDGVLDEQFATKLVRAHDPMANGIQTSLELPLALGSVRGSFRISARVPEARQGDQVFFRLWLDPEATLRGIMGGTFAHGEEASLERFFCLPDDQCY